MIDATCHCGAVRLEADEPPSVVTECNCSICRRLGVLWAYYTTATARVVRGAGETAIYAWGDRMIAFHHCRTCGCTTHYTGLGESPGDRIAINARLMPLTSSAPVPVRRFDGAESWKPAGEGETWPWPVPPAKASP